MKNEKTRTLVECALLVAMATVLSLVKIWSMPLGGSVTLLSMLPICLISVRHGMKWGVASAFVYSLIQLFLDLGAMLSWGLTPAMFIGSLLLDYIVAFTVLGLAGAFRNKGFAGIMAGVFMAIFLRFVSHVISGTIIFDIWMPEEWTNPFLYSICYNGAFLLPETIITMIACPAIVTALSKIKGGAKTDAQK